MKKSLVLLAALIVAGCGMSESERRDLADATCWIVSNTKQGDAASRIREINSARNQLGEDVFLGDDLDILQSFHFDLCPELVLNDENYWEKIESRSQAEQKKVLEDEERQKEKKREDAEKAKQRAEQKKIDAKQTHERGLEKFKITEGNHVLKCGSKYFAVNFDSKNYSSGWDSAAETVIGLKTMNALDVKASEISWKRADDASSQYETRWVYDLDSEVIKADITQILSRRAKTNSELKAREWEDYSLTSCSIVS